MDAGDERVGGSDEEGDLDNKSLRNARLQAPHHVYADDPGQKIEITSMSDVDLSPRRLWELRFPKVWLTAGSSGEREWRQILRLHEGGTKTLVVVDADQRRVPSSFLEVDPSVTGVQFLLFSNTAQAELTEGFAPHVRIYRQLEEAVDHEIARFLPTIYLSGMLAGVEVILVTEDQGLKNSVLCLEDKDVKTSKMSVEQVVRTLRSRHSAFLPPPTSHSL
ncbi:hypothetical protein DFQ27_006993 [Actinomortierella ambigua]|uniref:Uncharacterized protein n=1 Tax=Actinomortierella ambigua TaxID=1343610 RepID=A0A9P6U0R6_9FUNG|nr:hypothetical protein DFQ27_006993 [Actinomortierella ambigua]